MYHIPHLPHVVCYSLRSSQPEDIQRGSHNHAFKHLIIDQVRVNTLPLDIWLWRFGHCKGIQRWSPGHDCLKRNSSLTLVNDAHIEVSRHLDLKLIEGISGETRRAPCCTTHRKTASAQALSWADDPWLVDHSTLTFVAGCVPSTPLSYVPVWPARERA